MICPDCKLAGLKSTVTKGRASRTLAYCPWYFDEEGRRHNHDGNKMTISYECSNGHRFAETTSGACWCGWKG